MTISLISNIKYNLGILAAAGTLYTAQPAQAQKIDINQKPDVFIKSLKTQTAEQPVKTTATVTNPVDKYTQEDLPKVFRETVNPSSWTNDPQILKNAPDPYFTLMGKKTLAKGVVDVTNCRLYIYDGNGKPVESFKVAVGAPKTPTRPGIRKVLGKQTYPYKNCPRNSKRYRFPYDYGPRLAYLNVVDTITGEMHDNGGYFHGTKHESAVSREYRHVTHSCTRVHNRDALYIINDVFKIGDFLKYIKR